MKEINIGGWTGFTEKDFENLFPFANQIALRTECATNANIILLQKLQPPKPSCPYCGLKGESYEELQNHSCPEIAPSRYYKVKDGYVTLHSEGPYGAWTNWHDSDGQMIASLERLPNMETYIEFAKNEGYEEITQEEFRKLPKASGA